MYYPTALHKFKSQKRTKYFCFIESENNLEETSRDNLGQFSVAKTTCLRIDTLHTPIWVKYPKYRDFTASLDNLFQILITLSAK